MARYLLTIEAQHSLQHIESYSTKEFGKKQTVLYLTKLRDRMRFLAENPKLGVERTDLLLDWLCHSYPEGSHIIYYEIHSDHIVIIDVLHRSMEPELHL